MWTPCGYQCETRARLRSDRITKHAEEISRTTGIKKHLNNLNIELFLNIKELL